MPTLSASKEWIEREADSIEQSAKDSLRAWMLAGQTEKYVKEMTKAAALRRIAEVRGISERRLLLRQLGYAA